LLCKNEKGGGKAGGRNLGTETKTGLEKGSGILGFKVLSVYY